MARGFLNVLALSLFVAAGGTSAFATGAIAVNDGLGTAAEDVGYATGYGANQPEAEANAIKECKGAGNDQCKVVVWFEQCGAYVGDRAKSAARFGETKEAAEKMAMDKCPDCKLIVSECQ